MHFAEREAIPPAYDADIDRYRQVCFAEIELSRLHGHAHQGVLRPATRRAKGISAAVDANYSPPGIIAVSHVV